MTPEIYLATVGLEPNRWAKRQGQPNLAVASEWFSPAKAAGFSGIELFEPHYLEPDDKERQRILQAELPVSVYNSYITFDPQGEALRKQAAAAITQLKPKAFKFNFGRDPNQLADEMRCFEKWLETLPAEVEAWCECHPGTPIETPAAAKICLDQFSEKRIKVVFHPFLLTPEEVDLWMQTFGERVVHAHVQTRDPNEAMCVMNLEERADYCIQQLKLLHDSGFRGSYAVEFVKGTLKKDEDVPAKIFQQAVKNLNFLKQHILR
jgi:sugar phosphate isomerase/epimerase